ncbi:PIG-L family deacetylase [bacterium]|nr:PIG-L family deacetylase [bacterium]
MPFQNHKKILAIGAHPDDIELGCAGLIAKCVDMGAEVYTSVMSRCDDQFTEEEKGALKHEYCSSTNLLGISKTFLYDFPNKELPEHRIEIMDILNNMQRDISPDLVLIPSLNDPHQDHSAVASSAIRTFRGTETILQYEILRHGSHTFTPTLFVDIADHLDKKLEALSCYKTQLERRAYFDNESFKALARTRGAQSGYEFAEGFVIYKMFW